MKQTLQLKSAVFVKLDNGGLKETVFSETNIIEY